MYSLAIGLIAKSIINAHPAINVRDIDVINHAERFAPRGSRIPNKFPTLIDAAVPNDIGPIMKVIVQILSITMCAPRDTSPSCAAKTTVTSNEKASPNTMMTP